MHGFAGPTWVVHSLWIPSPLAPWRHPLQTNQADRIQESVQLLPTTGDEGEREEREERENVQSVQNTKSVKREAVRTQMRGGVSLIGRHMREVVPSPSRRRMGSHRAHRTVALRHRRTAGLPPPSVVSGVI
jgi:hypothetical protein